MRQTQKAFEPYYEKTLLSEGTDPNLLYDLERRLREFPVFDGADLEAFARIYFRPGARHDQLYAALAPTVRRAMDLPEEEQFDFRGVLTDYVRLYAFLPQILTFADADLEKLYVFARLVRRYLPVERDYLPVEIQRSIDMESYRIRQTFAGRVKLARGQQEVEPVGPGVSHILAQEQLEPLSQIIRELNERFGTDFAEDDRVFIRELEDRPAVDQALVLSVRVNTPENARLTFDHVVSDRLQDMVDTNFRFYKQVTDD